MHTGCLSAAPQRFVIGSNSFRTRTCFEEPLHPHCSRSGKPASNRCGSPSPKGFAPPKTIPGSRITASKRGKHHAPATPVHISFRAAHHFSRSPICGAPSGYSIQREAARSTRQSEFPDELPCGSATHHRKGRRAPPFLPVQGIRADLCRRGRPRTKVRHGVLGQGDGAVSSTLGFS